MKLAGFALEVPKLSGFRAEPPKKWPEIRLGLSSKNPENPRNDSVRNFRTKAQSLAPAEEEGILL